MNSRFFQTVFRFSSLLLMGCLSLFMGNTQAATYTITDLGANIQPLSITDAGQIVGIDTSVTPPRAVYRSGGSWLTLHNAGKAVSAGDSGLIAGHIVNTPNRAQLWRDGQAINELDAFSGMLEGRGINGLDEVVGVRQLDSGVRRPFIFDYITGSLKTLTTLGGAEGWANAINQRGQVTGSAQDSNAQPTAFIYSPDKETFTSLQSLNGFNGSEGSSINDAGTVAGLAFSGSSENPGRRAILTSTGKGIINLGALDKDVTSLAKGINNGELVVGQSIGANGNERAFLYEFASTELPVITAAPDNLNRVLTGDTKGAGIYQSLNKGLTWDTANIGLNDKRVSCIVFDETNHNILYACTDGGLYKSINGGVRWSFISQGIDKPTTFGTGTDPAKVFVVLIDKRDANHLFAGAEGGLFESKDAGATWNQLTDVIGAVYDVIQQPGSFTQFFAATSRGVYRFREGTTGATWQLSNGDARATPPTGLVPAQVAALAIDPKQNGILFAGTLGGSVYSTPISTEGPLIWSKKSTGMTNTEMVYSLKFDTTDFTTVGNNNFSKLYAGTTRGLFTTTDQGTTWTRNANFQTGGVYSMSFSSNFATLYLTTHDGNSWYTTDKGANWTNITRGSVIADTYEIVNVPTSPPVLLAGSSKGIFKLNVDTWQATFSAAAGTKVVAIAANTLTNPATYWIGTTDKGIYRSTDGGSNWNTINSGLNNWNVYALIADTSLSPVRLYAGTMSGVYRSDNNGDSWTLVNNGLNNGNVYSLLLDTHTSPNRLYAGTGNGVYRSTDNGNNWVPVNAGLQNIPISSLLITSTNHIYAASTKSGVFKSTNDAVTWSSTNQIFPANPLPNITVHAIKRDLSNKVYAATANGVYKFDDTDGWHDINLGANGATLKQTEVFGLEVIDANTIYAGTNNKGVYSTTNGGTTWSVLDQGLTETSVTIQDITGIVNNADWELRDATAINNNGQIIGWGLYQGQPHGYLLTPGNGTLTANLSISQSVYPTTIKKGIPLTFQIRIYNAGPATATHMRLKNWLPPNIVYHHASTNNGNCVKEPGETVRCELFDLAPGAAAIVNISLQPNAEGQKLRNIAQVRADQTDTDFSDNITGETDYVQVDRCFIATAAYGSFLDPHVETLRNFRDEVLLNSAPGREFVKYYYQYSPQLAKIIREHASLKLLTQLILTPIVYAIAYPIAAILILSILGIWCIRRQFRRRPQAVTATSH